MEEKIVIHSRSIELAAFLKWAQVVSTGGEAKVLITSGNVRVNGEVETRRGRTLLPGDIVSVARGPSFRVSLQED